MRGELARLKIIQPRLGIYQSKVGQAHVAHDASCSAEIAGYLGPNQYHPATIQIHTKKS
jgi:hypothetical protein